MAIGYAIPAETCASARWVEDVELYSTCGLRDFLIFSNRVPALGLRYSRVT